MSAPMIQTLADALAKRAYTDLTPVQIAVTDPALRDADLLVSAQTGSGKTVGFGLAIAPTLLGDAERFGPAATPLALVIAPTRELALQVKREFEWLFAATGAVIASCVGGMDMRDERRSLDRGAHIVVATPGRLKDHIMRGSMDMSDLRAVVLDEADEMLDLGFREDLEFILGKAPETRRTLMFSATVPRAIATLAQNYQTNAVRVSTTEEKSQHADIEYRALNVAAQDVENAIINVLRYYEAGNALVFCNTRLAVNHLTARFTNRGFAVVALSGELSQNERTHALQAMRDGRARVCVATDVAARGIDLPNLELVIHADLPTNGETLLHRSGRTGRAGRKGVSALIVPVRSRSKAERLLKFAKINAEWGPAPSAEDVLARDEERLMSDPVWEQDLSPVEQVAVEKLLALHAPEKIAAAFLRLNKGRNSAPEELAAAGADAPKGQRGAFGPGKWFSISVGLEQNAEARRLLPMLCRVGNLSKDDIGAIRVQENESFVEILATSVPGFLAAVGKKMVLEDGVNLRQLDHAPDLGNTPRPPPRGDKPKWQKRERPAQDDRSDNRPKPAFSPRPHDGGKPSFRKSDASKVGHKPKSNYNPDTGAPKDVVIDPAKPKAAPRPKDKSAGKPKWAKEGGKKAAKEGNTGAVGRLAFKPKAGGKPKKPKFKPT